MYNRVILPTDGSSISFKGVEEGLKIAKLFNIPAVAIYVISPKDLTDSIVSPGAEEVVIDSYDILEDRLKKNGEIALEKVEDLAQKIGIEIETKILNGYPHEEITKEAGDDDIIYISSHGHSGFTKLFLGSTTDKIIKNTKCTVAIVKPNKDKNK